MTAKWYWKSDLRLKDDNDSAWKEYDAALTQKLEKAHQKGQKTLKLTPPYSIDFQLNIQHHTVA